MQVLVVFVLLMPGAPLPMSTLAQWWALPKRLVRGTQVLRVRRFPRPWAAVQVDREVGRECGLVAVAWERERTSVRASLVDYTSDQKYR